MPITLKVRNLQDEAAPQSTRMFEHGPVTIGRIPGNHLVLDDPSKAVSAHHARLEGEGTSFQVMDLKSTNGTWLNEQQLRPRETYVLKSGDRMVVGPWELSCEISLPAKAEPPPRKPKAASALPASAPLHEIDVVSRGPQLVKHLAASPRPTWDALLPTSLAGVPSHQVLAVLRFALDQAPTVTDLGVREALVEALAEWIDRESRLREMAFVELANLARAFEVPVPSAAAEVTAFRMLLEQTLRQTLEWIWSCLSGRKEFTANVNAKVTQMFSLGGNPIKNALDAKEIGQHILDWAGEASPAELEENLRDAFRDLTAHQIAIVAGVQEATKAAFALMDPDKVEEEAAKEAKGPFRAIGANSRAWQRFKATWRDLTDNDSKLMNEVIYPTLRKAYLEAHQRNDLLKRPGDS